MTTEITELFELASIKAGGDAALARALGWSRAYVSMIRSGERAITTETAAQIAEVAGVPVEVALVAAMEARAKSPKERAGWQTLRRLVMVMAVMLLVGGMVPTSALAAENAGNPYRAVVSADARAIYIMRRRLSDWRSKFRAALLRWRTGSRLLTRALRCRPPPGSATA